MRTRRGPASFLTFAAFIAASCGGTRTPPAPPPAKDGTPATVGPFGGPTADQLLDAGDPGGAVAIYEAEARSAPNDLVLAEKVRTARRLAAEQHALKAAAAFRRDDLGTALGELELAERYDKDAPPVRKLREAVGPKVATFRSVAEAKDKARELLSSDPAAAVAILEQARTLAPSDPGLVELLVDATRRAEGDRAAIRAEEAWTAGVRSRAVEHLASAEIGGRPVPRAHALRRRIENDLLSDPANDLDALRGRWRLATDARLTVSVVDTLRDRLAEGLARASRALDDAGRPAAAALLELERRRLGARTDTKVLDRVRAENAIVLHVTPFTDATGSSLDGTRLARAIRDRIALDATRGSVPIVATTDLPPQGAVFPHVVVEGEAKSFRATSGRVGRETQPLGVPAAGGESVSREVVTFVKTATLSARVRVVDAGTTLLDELLHGSEVHRETVAPAVPATGTPEDPDETPDDLRMASASFDRLAENASGPVRTAAEKAARRLLEEGRALEGRGESDAAAEKYAVFLLITSETATPERAEAARALHRILGAAPVLQTGYRPEVRR